MRPTRYREIREMQYIVHTVSWDDCDFYRRRQELKVRWLLMEQNGALIGRLGGDWRPKAKNGSTSSYAGCRRRRENTNVWHESWLSTPWRQRPSSTNSGVVLKVASSPCQIARHRSITKYRFAQYQCSRSLFDRRKKNGSKIWQMAIAVEWNS